MELPGSLHSPISDALPVAAEPVNILLVDDSPLNLCVLEATLSVLGHKLVKAHSGEAALKCVADETFAVILLDVQMPGLDGFETAARIRVRAQTANTPLIFLTASETADWQIFQGYALGAVDYMVKPYVADVLTAKVRAFIELFQKSEALRRQSALLHQVNEKLQHSIRDQQAVNHELEAFSYSVSHDLRAPLRTIDGFSLALWEDYGDKLDAVGRDYLQRVRAATQRMGRLIDDILELARVTRSEMNLGSVDLSGLARHSADELRQREPQRDVVFAIEDGLQARGDSRLLAVVLDNLLGNAWKYTSKHSSARIEFGKRDAPDGASTYFVRDDGAGFDMTYVAKLFGAFQRLHGQAEFPGDGVGLATVQRIIHRHGGRIWAEGALEQGAVFWFTL